MIKYLGSKRALLPWILHAVDEFAPRSGTALDLFSGTSRVGHALKRVGWRVLANDHNAYAATLARCYVQADREAWGERAAALVQEANAVARAAVPEAALMRAGADLDDPLPAAGGWFTEDYCRRSRYFRPVNGLRIEAVRDWIAALGAEPVLEAVLLTSLMEAADRVDSTTGVQMAYLKRWAARAHNVLELRVPALLPRAAAGAGRAMQLEALEAAASEEVDLAYLDPPYNQHKYLGNYHVWESLVLWDAPEVYGVACKRVDCRTRRSDFNSKPRFRAAFEALVDAVRAPRLVVSFSNEGYLARDEMEALLAARGRVQVLQSGHERYVGARIGIHNPAGEKVGTVSHTRNREFLFLVEKG
jgi:adenine-specific DNA-methyltransferase